jgi:Chaperone of endosialidase
MKIKTKNLTSALRVPDAFGLIPVVIVCLALTPVLQAVSPAPDGGYPAEGTNALFSLTTGTNNTAVGSQALSSVATGNQNTATGAQALKNNTAFNNTANGFQALVSNTTGFNNTATGWRALYRNTTAGYNTATGSRALYLNSEGYSNTATGNDALLNNSSGQANTATGAFTLTSHTTGDRNTATGSASLSSNRTGSFNTSNGSYALFDLATGSNNIALGSAAGCTLTSGDNNIIIGNQGVGNESNTIRIGSVGSGMGCGGVIQPSHTSTYIAGIFGATVSGGSPVYVTPDGHLGTSTSSARFKTQIQEMNKTSEALFALKPVTFRYKKEIDPAGKSPMGLLAEDVEKVNPDLVVRDNEGKAYSVRYDQVNAMLLNEFLKEHKTVQEQGATIARLEKQIEALTADLQKVNAQLDQSRNAPQMVLNDR